MNRRAQTDDLDHARGDRDEHTADVYPGIEQQDETTTKTPKAPPATARQCTARTQAVAFGRLVLLRAERRGNR